MPDNQFFTATVSGVSPDLTVKIYPADDAITCRKTSHLLDIAIGSNVVVMKILNQFLVIAVIDNIFDDVGLLTALSTDAKTSIVAAINEVDSHADSASSSASTANTNIGTLSSLTTTTKTNLVAAINEVDSHADTAQSAADSAATAASTASTAASNKVRYIRKSSNESVSSSSSLQNDNDFNITLEANTTYEIMVALSVSGSNTGNLRLSWSKGSGVTIYNRIKVGPYQAGGDSGNTNVNMISDEYNNDAGYTTDGTNNSSIIEMFVVSTGSSSNTLVMRWAQITSDSTATTITSNSYMKITKLTSWS
jgi:hypothetical protein